MKKTLTPFFILWLLLPGCSPDETTVGIERHPLISFATNDMSWQAERYSFAAPAQVVAYPADTTQPGRLYNRMTLNARGENTAGDNLQLTIMFDAEDTSRLVGVYRPLYTASSGLAQVQVFNLSNGPAAYALKPGDSTAVLQIQRQSESERLMAGRFQMTLYNTRDSTETINITTGIFKDVRY